MKNTLRLILLSVLLILGVTMMAAQTVYRDVVYLKNGSVIKGTIVETIPEKSIKIETVDGNLFVYNLSDIEKLTKEAVTAPVKESKPVLERLGNDNQRSTETQRSYETPRSYESQRGSEGAGSIFSIYGALALPLGDFGKKEAENGAGLAKTGWSGGLQFVTGGMIGWIIDGSYTMNKIQIPSNYTTASGKLEYTGWTSILALTGVKIGTDNSSGTNFFVAPLVGALFGKSPEITFTPTGGSASTSPAGTGTAFAYGGTVEAIVGGHVTIGAKFIASKPKFKYSVNGQDYEGEQKISLLLVCLGFAF